MFDPSEMPHTVHCFAVEVSESPLECDDGLLIAFILTLTATHYHIARYMERNPDNLRDFVDECIAQAYLGYLVAFCGTAWLLRHHVTEIIGDSTRMNYILLMVPAMSYGIIADWISRDHQERPNQWAESCKV